MKIAPMVIGPSLMKALGAVAVGLAIAFTGSVCLAAGNKLNIDADSVFAQAQDTIRLTTGKWQPYTSKSASHYGIASHVVTEGFALVGVEVEYGFSPWKRARKLT